MRSSGVPWPIGLFVIVLSMGFGAFWGWIACLAYTHEKTLRRPAQESPQTTSERETDIQQ